MAGGRAGKGCKSAPSATPGDPPGQPVGVPDFLILEESPKGPNRRAVYPERPGSRPQTMPPVLGKGRAR
eukprot:2808267-Lingulodinium_polyedra.AAC.1